MEGRLSQFEVNALVRGLDRFSVSSVGSDRWMSQHDVLEKLNIQAHVEAMSRHDETVVDAVVQHEKVETIVHELLVIEAWKEKIFPLLIDHFSPVTALKAYIVLYHEATLCNLLEVLLYHASVCEAGGDAMVELVDYCARKINALNAGQFKALQEDKPEDPKASLNRSTQDNLRRQHLDVGFGVCVCSISMLRFLTDHMNLMPLGVTSRMLHTHDILLALVPLVENPPWTRRRQGGQTEKFIDQKWSRVTQQDLPLLTKLEGQVWLAIYNLLMDKNARKQYQYNSHRKQVIVRLRRFFTDLLLDQLPLLRELKRLIEELSIMDPPPPTASSVAIIEAVPEMREEIIKDKNWKEIAQKQKSTVFANDESARQRDIARLAATYNLDSFDEALGAPSCGECGKSGEGLKRCSRCKSEWYCGRTCQVAAWKKHQKICDILAKDVQRKEAEKKKQAANKTAATETKPATKSASSSSRSSGTSSKPASEPIPAAVASGKIQLLDEMD